MTSGAENELPAATTPQRRRLLEIASRLSGALAGAGTTLVAGPFAGAATAVGVSEGLVRLAGRVAPVADEVLAGPLGPREQERAVAVIGFALGRIGERLREGDPMRDDGFLDGRDGHRSDAAQLLEGAMREAAHSYNERRVRHLGYLWASFVFAADPPGYAYYLLDTAQRLTYRQMVALVVLAEHGKFLPDWEGELDLEAQDPALFAELTHLGRNRLLVRSYGQSVATIDQVNPADMVPAPLGERLIAGLELARVPPSDRHEITQAMWRLNEYLRERRRASASTHSSDRSGGRRCRTG